MRISAPETSNVPVAAAAVITPKQAFDVVPPSRLFSLAIARFESAIATTRIGGHGTAPSAIVAVMAIQQAESGLRSLKSVIVPSTSLETRNRAALAAGHAQSGIELLRRYHAAVVTLGDRAHPNDQLPAETLALLEGGRFQLRTAGAVARRS